MKLTLKYFLTVFVLIGAIAFSQNKLPPKLKFNSFTVENGLPNNIVNSIVQDSLGFVWIGTNDGLCRFDGKNAKVFRQSIENKNSISNNFIQSLFVDSKGDLWIMTDQGLNKFNSKTESFERYLSGNKNSISYNSITSMVERSNGDYIIGTYGGGIDILSGKEFIFNFNQNKKNSITSNLISSLQLQHDSILWVGNWQEGINKINLNSKKIFQYKYGASEITNSGRINALYLDSQHYLWIGTNEGLTVFNTINDSYFKINTKNCSTFTDDDILSIFENEAGEIWLGTRNSGIISGKRINILGLKNKVKFKNYLPKDSDESISYRSVSTFFQDNQKNIWIGTHLKGVNIVSPEGDGIRFYDHFVNSKLDVNSKSTWGICEDNNSNIWVGTDGGGLFKFNPFSNKMESYIHQPSKNRSISDNAILSSYADKKGNLWFGTYAGGLNKYSPIKNEFKHYNEFNKKLYSNDIRVIFEDREGKLWVGTNGSGLNLYNEITDSFEIIDEIGYIDVRAIAEDFKGNLWIGTFGNGVFSYNKKSKTTQIYPNYDALNAHIVFDIECTTENDIWIGTRFKGLVHLNYKTGKVEQFTQSNGLTNNTVQSIVAQSLNELWISTNDGLNLLNVKTKKFDSYKAASGVQTGPFNNNSGFLSRNGYMVFGGVNGLNIFYPDDIIKNNNLLDIVFTDFKLFNKSVKVSSDLLKTPLTKSISNTKEINLKHNQDVITIEYNALNFPSSKGLNYEYILENNDNHWSKVGGLTSATYRNLSPGEYIFKVRISDEAGNWNSETSKIKISISPPFWLTIPAIILYIILILTLAYIVLKYYTNQIKLRNSLFYTQKLRQQETELNKERFRFFTNFSHELRTPLTLILGPITDILRNAEKNKNTKKLNLIKRNAQILLELINKMLEFRKSETEHNHLEIGRYNFTNFVKEVSANFEFYANQKEIDFKLKIQQDYFAWFDYKKIQLVIFNLLSNAFKYTPKEGSVTLEIKESFETISLIISDTGVGIKQEALDSIFNLYYHTDYVDTIEGTGIGLALCKKLMDLHNAKIFVESTINKGSIFTVELFKNKNHFLKLNNIEFLNSNNFKIKKPFINDSLFIYKDDKQIKLNKYDRVVLVVDDNLDVVNYLNDILSDYYKVISANNGKIGVEIAMAEVPNLIISDVMMPEKSGIDLCKELKNYHQTSHIPIILLTAKLGDKDRLEGMKIGADDYITKPFDSQFLLARIDNLFKNRKKLIKFYNESSEKLSVTKNPNIEDEFLLKLEQIVIEKYNGNDISIPEIASELGFSRSSLYRKVKAVTGESINSFVKRVRLQKAAKLISENQLNVSEAAYECGFNDLKHFRKSFKDQFGVTPSKY